MGLLMCFFPGRMPFLSSNQQFKSYEVKLSASLNTFIVIWWRVLVYGYRKMARNDPRDFRKMCTHQYHALVLFSYI